MYSLTKKDNEQNRSFCMSLLVMAVTYNIFFGFTRNPAGTDNTLSWIGYDHPFGFFVWGVATSEAFFFNILYMYKKYNYVKKAGNILLHAGLFCAPAVVFINDWGWEQTAHLVATLAFIAFNSIAMLIPLIKNFKKSVRYKYAVGFIFAVLGGMIIIQFTIGKSGLMELVPIWLILALVFVINFTGFCPVVDKESKENKKAPDMKKAQKLAWILGIFGAHDYYLGRWKRAAAHVVLTEVGIFICLVPIIGFGIVNELNVGDGWLCFATGISMIAGSLAWGFADACEIIKAGFGTYRNVDEKELAVLEK